MANISILTSRVKTFFSFILGDYKAFLCNVMSMIIL